jgi:hypothetical protein
VQQLIVAVTQMTVIAALITALVYGGLSHLMATSVSEVSLYAHSLILRFNDYVPNTACLLSVE